MRKIFLIVYFISNIIAIAQVDTAFFGLRGYEDLEGNSQLFFRMLSHFQVERTEGNYKGITRRDIFHRDVEKKIDSLFILDFIDFHQPLPQIGKVVTDFEFTDSTLTDFYQCGDGVFTSYESDPIVVFNRDYDNYIGINSFGGITSNLEITKVDSKTNVYVSLSGEPSGIFTNSEYGDFDLVESTEGFILISINNSSPNIWFVEDEHGYLYKSIDTGKTFSIVDSSIVDINSNNFYFEIDYINRYFLYDSGSLHIYRVIKDENKFQVSVSNNKGELNSWNRRFESTKELFISVDYSLSGNIYIATDKQIIKSDDYGETFSLYTELKNKIVGIYKKPNSDLLYVTTSHSLLEINSDSVRILKGLIDYEALSSYPLHIGDKWYYDVKRIEYGSDFYPNETNYQIIREVKKDTTLNNKKYFEVKETSDYNNSVNYTYLRIDTLNGKVYQYEETFESDEFIKEDLIIEKDNYFNSWINYYEQPIKVEVYFLDVFDYPIFETNTISKISKKYEFNGPYISEYYLSKDIGKSFQYKGIVDGFDEYHILKAAYINDEKYGDSTLVGIEKNFENLPKKFSLSQNYPNPFNPSTKIEYSLPAGKAGIQKSEFVSLKVFDVLGREVATLVNKEQKHGNYEISFDASNLTSGIYFYRIRAGDFANTKKMILIK